jgi:hypothetical protein
VVRPQSPVSIVAASLLQINTLAVVAFFVDNPDVAVVAAQRLADRRPKAGRAGTWVLVA